MNVNVNLILKSLATQQTRKIGKLAANKRVREGALESQRRIGASRRRIEASEILDKVVDSTKLLSARAYRKKFDQFDRAASASTAFQQHPPHQLQTSDSDINSDPNNIDNNNNNGGGENTNFDWKAFREQRRKQYAETKKKADAYQKGKGSITGTDALSKLHKVDVETIRFTHQIDSKTFGAWELSRRFDVHVSVVQRILDSKVASVKTLQLRSMLQTTSGHLVEALQSKQMTFDQVIDECTKHVRSLLLKCDEEHQYLEGRRKVGKNHRFLS